MSKWPLFFIHETDWVKTSSNKRDIVMEHFVSFLVETVTSFQAWEAYNMM